MTKGEWVGMAIAFIVFFGQIAGLMIWAHKDGRTNF